MKYRESNIQQSIIKWARVCDHIYPELKLLHAIPNGANVSEKNRMRLVSEGLKKGIPDLFLPVARDNFHGLYIELKSETGRLTDTQKEVFEELKQQHYKVVLCSSVYDAINELETYLKRCVN